MRLGGHGDGGGIDILAHQLLFCVGLECATQRADRGPAPLEELNPRRDNLQFFNGDAFQNPRLGTFGNAGRGVLIGPGVNNWDLTVGKTWALPENARLQLRAEFFNAWNHTQFDGVAVLVGTNQPASTCGGAVACPNLPNYGQVTSTRGPRNIQFALRLVF